MQNASQTDVYLDYSDDSTLLNLSYPPGSAPESLKVRAGAGKKLFYRDCFENFLITGSQNNRLYVFIFDAQTIETTNWDTVKNNHLLLRRYEFTKDQLDSQNWSFTYN